MTSPQTDYELQRLLDLCEQRIVRAYIKAGPTEKFAEQRKADARDAIWNAIKSAYEYGALNAQERRQAYEEEMRSQGVSSAEIERRIASVAMRRVKGDKWYEG